jgi:hypothetical protein
MEHASKVLWNALRKVARPERPLDLLVAMWPVLVGQRLAAHTQPVNWHKGRVDIEVTDPDWHRQIAGLGDEIRKQINRWWGTELVREVRLIQPKSQKSARRALEKTAPKKPVMSSETAEKHPLTQSHAERKLQDAIRDLDTVLVGISDEELRNLIAQVADKYLSGQGKK